MALSRRKRRKREAIKKRLAAAVSPPGDPNDYFCWLEDYMRDRAVLKVVIYVRVSTRKQRRNLKYTVAYIRQRLAELSEQMKCRVKVVGVFTERRAAWDVVRPKFDRAVRRAKKRGAVILAESSDRYTRNSGFRDDRTLLPTVEQLEGIKASAKDIPLLTLARPGETRRKVASLQIKRGQGAKGRKGGRPAAHPPGYKKRIRDEKLPDVLKLHQEGYSLAEIAAEKDIPRSTAGRWIARH